MMKLKILLLTFCILYFAFCSGGYAAFEDLSISARSIGMGGAFIAVADDASTLFYNPAGLFQITRPELLVNGSYLFHLSGNSLYGFIGYVNRISEIGHVGISLLSRGVNLSARYRENILGLSYCGIINPKISWGVTLKMCSKNYPDNTRTISAISDSRFFDERFPADLSADLACFFKPLKTEKLSVGISCTEIGTGIWGFRAGAGYKFDGFSVFNNIVGSTDIAIRGNGDFKLNLGYETWFKQTEGLKKIIQDNILGVRAGTKIGGDGDFSFVFGGSVKSNNIKKTDWKLDCAFALPYHSSTEFFTGGAWVSLSFLFGDADRWEKERLEREKEKRAKEELEKLLREHQKALEDLKKLEGLILTEDNEKIIIVAQESAIRFASGSAEILPESYEALDLITNALKAYPGSIILIEGHTDNVPISPRLKAKYPSNLELSKDRAENVAQYFVKQDIADEKLIKKGYGEKKPIALNTSEEGRIKNRRVEITIQK